MGKVLGPLPSFPFIAEGRCVYFGVFLLPSKAFKF